MQRPKLLYQYNALFYICNKFVRVILYVIFPENDSHASISLEKAFLYNTSFPRRSVYTEPKSKRILRKKRSSEQYQPDSIEIKTVTVYVYLSYVIMLMVYFFWYIRFIIIRHRRVANVRKNVKR